MTRIILGHKVKRKKPAWKKALVAAVVLLVLMIGGFILYIYMGWGAAPVQKKAAEYKPINPLKEPKKETANTPASVAQQSFSSPVAPGENVVLTIRTNQNAACKIVVKYNDVQAVDSGLVDKSADEWGMVTWAWTVPKTTPEGEWPVLITCVKGAGKWAKLQLDLKVSRAVAAPVDLGTP